MTGAAHIIRGNALSLPLADNSVDLVVTSPPYFALRSYQDGGEHYAGQLGSEATPTEFVDALIAATREMVRVTKPSGSIWVNLGDKYAGVGGPNQSGAAVGETARRQARTQNHLYDARSRNAGGVRSKSLFGIPWRYAIRCIDELGLILRAEVVWSKPNGLPESVTDRVRRSHETWFHFVLSPRYYSAVDEIRESHKPGQSPSALSFNREGRGTAPGQSMAPHRLGRDDQGTNPLGKLPGSVWTIATEPLRVPDHLGIDHFAAFPTEWPRRIIQGWSPAGVCVECGEGRRPVVDRQVSGHEGVAGHISAVPNAPDGREGARKSMRATILGYVCNCVGHSPPVVPAVVLDPFGGTGTTALVAKALGRTGISVDMSADYCRLAEWRTNDPDQLAKAARVNKPPKQVDGQLGFEFEEIA